MVRANLTYLSLLQTQIYLYQHNIKKTAQYYNSEREKIMEIVTSGRHFNAFG